MRRKAMPWASIGLIFLLAGCGANEVGNRRATVTTCARDYPVVSVTGAYIATEQTRDGIHTRFVLRTSGELSNVSVPPDRIVVPGLYWTLDLTPPPGIAPPTALLIETQTYSTPPGDTVGQGVDVSAMTGPPLRMGETYRWGGAVSVSPLAQGFAGKAGAMWWPQFETPMGMVSAGQLMFDLRPEGAQLRATNFRVGQSADCEWPGRVEPPHPAIIAASETAGAG